jgi:hypothetical protein
MTKLEIIVWFLDLAFLARILWQGEIIIKTDKEKLDLERKSFRMSAERYEERAKWRQEKQKQKLKKEPIETNITEKPTVGP